MSDVRSERMVQWAERVLTILIWLNVVALFGFVLVLLGTSYMAVGNRLEAAEGRGAITGVRLALVIAILIVPLAHIALSRLRSIVVSVRAGDPFHSENARRLTAIAWSLLGIMLLDVAYGALAWHFDEAPDWVPSITAWLAVILLFVLARVFDHGARMREELAGTV